MQNREKTPNLNFHSAALSNENFSGCAHKISLSPLKLSAQTQREQHIECSRPPSRPGNLASWKQELNEHWNFSRIVCLMASLHVHIPGAHKTCSQFTTTPQKPRESRVNLSDESIGFDAPRCWKAWAHNKVGWNLITFLPLSRRARSSPHRCVLIHFSQKSVSWHSPVPYQAWIPVPG